MGIVGQQYAYREKARVIGEPVEQIIVVKEGPPKSRKVRIRHLDGEYEGFEEWVPQSRLLVPWEEAKAFCDDERRLKSAVAASKNIHETIAFKAAEEVFGAITEIFGEELIVSGLKAIERNLVIIEEFEETVKKLGLKRGELLSEPYAFVDRFGNYKAPLNAHGLLVTDFCGRFPKEIIRCIQVEENKLQKKILSASNLHEQQFAEEWLIKYKPVFAVVREWCGEQALIEFNEIGELRKENLRLRKIIQDIADWLKDVGHTAKAALILKEL